MFHINRSSRCGIHWYYCPRKINWSIQHTRIAQWCARRGTLQEELNNVIANEIQKATGTKNLGVHVQATHGCCENRGIMATSSPTQTTVLRGAFYDDPKHKERVF